MAFDAFIFFEDAKTPIEGETKDSTYSPKKASEIFSFSFGLSNPTQVGLGSGMSAGKASYSSLNIMKRMDAGSIALTNACATGGHIEKATMVVRKAGGEKPLEYIKYLLEGVFVESIQYSGSSGGDDYPTESVALAFGKITIEYTKQKDDGTADGGALTFSRNLLENTK
jgi:type VI secretion system secreted protein Hcp